MPDPIFDHWRLAAIYDQIDDDRSDLGHYEAILEALGARTVLDIGCGTGVLACRLAARGIAVTGVDPQRRRSMSPARSATPIGSPGCTAMRYRSRHWPSMPSR